MRLNKEKPSVSPMSKHETLSTGTAGLAEVSDKWFGSPQGPHCNNRPCHVGLGGRDFTPRSHRFVFITLGLAFTGMNPVGILSIFFFKF